MDTTTELSTVNGMLSTIGEAPVNTLEDTGLIDVALARQIIRDVTRSVLVDGWAFNTDTDFPFSPEAFAPFAINIPPNAMSVIPSDAYKHLVVRGTRLYDTSRFSYDFQGHPPVPCQVIWWMTFAELPEVTRQYVAIRAARVFQAKTTAAEIIELLTEAEERQARWAHNRHNVRVRRKNFLYDTASARRVLMNR